MHPVLFQIGPFTLHTYGALAAIGFLVGISLASIEGKRKGFDAEKIADLGLYLLISAIIGSRIAQVAVEHQYYIAHPLEILMIWRGGLVFYGGFIGAVVVGVFYLRLNKMPVWPVSDVFAVGIPLGHAIGRVGCLMAGCCYGCETHLPWAVTFTDQGSLAPLGVPLHPSQIYEALGNVAIFAVIFLYRKRIKFDGQLFWMYVMMYSVMRFTLEFLRGDTERGVQNMAGLNISTSQGIALLAFTTAIIMILKLRTVKPWKNEIPI